jgi:hypothetical protein
VVEVEVQTTVEEAVQVDGEHLMAQILVVIQLDQLL